MVPIRVDEGNREVTVNKLLTALLASLMIAGVLAGLDLTNSPIHANMNQMEKR